MELSLYRIFVCLAKYFPQIAERWKYSVQLPAKDASTGVSWFGGYYRSAFRRLNMCCGWNFELKCCCWFVLLMIFRYFRILAYSVYVFFGSQCMVFLSDTGPNGRRKWSWLHPPTWPSCPASRMLPLQGDSYIEHIFTGNNLIEHKF